MHVIFYRDACHPDMLFEIRTKLEDRCLDIRLTESVANLMNERNRVLSRQLQDARKRGYTP